MKQSIEVKDHNVISFKPLDNKIIADKYSCGPEKSTSHWTM